MTVGTAIKNASDTAIKVADLSNALSKEMYYGLNMKMELYRMIKEKSPMVEELTNFIMLCRSARTGKVVKSLTDDETMHTTDTDCTLDDTDTCTVCGVTHGDPCPECGGRGYHNEGCSGNEAD